MAAYHPSSWCKNNHKHNKITSTALESTWTGNKLLTSTQEVKFYKNLQTQSCQWHPAWKAGWSFGKHIWKIQERKRVSLSYSNASFLRQFSWRVLTCFGSKQRNLGVIQRWTHVSVIFSTMQHNSEVKTKEFFRIFTLCKLCRQVKGHPEYELLPFPYIKRGTRKTGLSQNVTWLPHPLQNFATQKCSPHPISTSSQPSAAHLFFP